MTKYKDMPLIIGLTGPTGSGKSTVAKLFEEKGFCIIDADLLARKVVEKGSATLSLLCRRFGNGILFEDGTLNRKKLSQIAFSTKQNTQDLNRITHPAIVQLVKDTARADYESGYDRIIYDAPTLFESKSDVLCDSIVCVIAPVSVRINRIMHRDGINYDEAVLRINAQKTDDFYTQKSDYVIVNDSSSCVLKQRTYDVISTITEVYNGTKV